MRAAHPSLRLSRAPVHVHSGRAPTKACEESESVSTTLSLSDLRMPPIVLTQQAERPAVEPDGLREVSEVRVPDLKGCLPTISCRRPNA